MLLKVLISTDQVLPSELLVSISVIFIDMPGFQPSFLAILIATSLSPSKVVLSAKAISFSSFFKFIIGSLMLYTSLYIKILQLSNYYKFILITIILRDF